MADVKVTDELRPLASLSADPRNARRHGPQQIAQIVRSIEEFGFIHRVVVSPDGQIIGGHATVEALKQLGRTEAEVRVVTGLSRAQRDKLALALNKIPESSDWDDDILREVIIDIREAGEDVLDIGFSAATVDKLLAGADEIEVREIDTSQVDDEFWVSIRGPLAHQATVLRAIEQAVASLPGVTVDISLGTIG